MFVLLTGLARQLNGPISSGSTQAIHLLVLCADQILFNLLQLSLLSFIAYKHVLYVITILLL